MPQIQANSELRHCPPSQGEQTRNACKREGFWIAQALTREVVCPLAAALTIRHLRSQWQICRRSHPPYTLQ
ncbi:hypothetical protein WJX82_007566 [Trebouxia sp. C0006]